jgi:hypothetical protein
MQAAPLGRDEGMRFMRKIGLVSLVAAALLVSGAAHAELLISVDKSTQRMTVTVDGEPKYVWPVSTGRSGHYTPAGTFTPFRLEADHYSKEWDDAPMPHSVFFTRQGHAIHGSFNTKQLGSPASAGCVRLAPANAALLFSMVKQHGLNATKVSIDGDEALVARRGNRGQVATVAPAQQPADGVSVWPNPFGAAASPDAPRMERPVRTERRAARVRTEPREYYEDRGYAPQARQGYYQEPSPYYSYQQRQAVPRGYRYYPYYAQ